MCVCVCVCVTCVFVIVSICVCVHVCIRTRENSNSNLNCLLYIGHRPLYKQRGWGGVGGVGGGGHGIKQGKRINKRVGGGGGSFTQTENYQFWYNCSVTHSYTYYQETVFFCLWHEK